MKIIDTITINDNSYTLALQNNGDYTITDSEGVVQELTGMAQAEAMDIFNQLYPEPQDPVELVIPRTLGDMISAFNRANPHLC